MRKILISVFLICLSFSICYAQINVVPYKILYNSQTGKVVWAIAGDFVVGDSTAGVYDDMYQYKIILSSTGRIDSSTNVAKGYMTAPCGYFNNIQVSTTAHKSYLDEVALSTHNIVGMEGANKGDIIWYDGSSWIKLSTTSANLGNALILFVSSVSWGTVAAGAAGVANPMTEDLDLGGYDTHDGDHGSYTTLIATTSGKFAGMSITNDGTKTTLLSKSGDYIVIGTGSTSQGLNNANDFLVTGKTELNGLIYADGTIWVNNNLLVNGQGFVRDNVYWQYGNNGRVKMSWQLAGSNKCFRTSLFCNNANYSGNWIVCEDGGKGIDWGVPLVVDPHFRIQSTNEGDTAEYIQFFSSSVAGGNGYLETGKDLVITPSGGDVYVNGNIRADAYEIHASSFFLHSLPNIEESKAIALIKNIKDGTEGLLDKSTMGEAYIPAYERTKTYKCRTLIQDSTWQYEITYEDVKIQEEAVTSMSVIWSAMIKTLQAQQKEIAYQTERIEQLEENAELIPPVREGGFVSPIVMIILGIIGAISLIFGFKKGVLK